MSAKAMSSLRAKQAKDITANLGSLTGAGTRKNSVSAKNKSDLFQFSLPMRGSFSAALTNLKANANLKLLDSSRTAVAASNERGTKSEEFSAVLEPGTYYIQVKAVGKGSTPFTLSYNLTTDSNQPTVNVVSFNTLPGRTSNDYFKLATLAKDAIYEFYLNENIPAYTLFSNISSQFARYADQGDLLALEYLKRMYIDASYARALGAAQAAYFL
jgi:hypothetical protein